MIINHTPRYCIHVLLSLVSTCLMLTRTQNVARPILSYLVDWCAWAGELLTSSNCPVNSAAIVGDFVLIMYPGFGWKVSSSSCMNYRFRKSANHAVVLAIHDLAGRHRFCRRTRHCQVVAEASSERTSSLSLLKHLKCHHVRSYSW